MGYGESSGVGILRDVSHRQSHSGARNEARSSLLTRDDFSLEHETELRLKPVPVIPRAFLV
ncbi:hypothetical protein PUN4_780057 [Paraburkholderia unamae]|nr:hypothetical protein PUN4_780057 [Paraburkholderia unamae]